MGGDRPKQYLPLAGRPMLVHGIEALLSEPRVNGVTVAIVQDDRDFQRLEFSRPIAVDSVAGGHSRAESVLNGLCHIATVHRADWVLVHDAARPCLPRECLADLLDRGLDSADGALLAIPVRDTVKSADPDQRVVGTIEREGLWAAQTPQLFPLPALLEAIEAMLGQGLAPTDEASAMERAGFRPLLVPGSPANLKVTVEADLPLAEAILAGAGVAK